MSKKYPTPQKSKLSVIIPAYNAEAWIGPTLKHLWRSLQPTKWRSIEIIVIDDGSTDGTALAAKSALKNKTVKVVSQVNQGRFETRKNGLSIATGDYIFFIDSRTYAHKGSFRALVKQMNRMPEAVVWNGHVNIDRSGNLQARFWHTITYIAWRKYLSNPKLTHYGIEDFDHYPKGTTCFFAPKDVLAAAYKQFRTSYEDLALANDDSSLIRYIAEKHDIYLDPKFCFTYNSRSTMKAFLKHTLHRGTVFIDGFLKPGTRYYYPLIVYLVGLPIFCLTVFLWPWLVVGVIAAWVMAGILALILGDAWRDSLSFFVLLPIFVILYTAGLYRGLWLRNKTS